MNFNPGVERRVKLFEMYRVSCCYRFMVLLVKRRADGFRKFFPHVVSQKLFARTLQNMLCLPVQIGESPLTVEGKKRVGYALENPFDSLVRFSQRLLGTLAFCNVA
jgi:hypothetical protein